MAATLNRWTWQARRWLDQAGLVGVAAVLLALFAGWVALGELWPLQDRLDQSTQRLGELQSRLDQRRAARLAAPDDATAATPAADAAPRVDDLLKRFASERALSDQLRQLHRIAARHGLVLLQGEFRLMPQDGLALSRYGMTLPVRAPYRALRAFLAQALREMPGLALQDISLQRSEAGDTSVATGDVDARLALVLYLRREN